MKRPQHVAIYLHTLYNGGVERVMLDLMRGFLAQGIRIDLVLDFLEYSPFTNSLPEKVNVVTLGAYGNKQRLLKFAGYLRKHRPDAVLSASHYANEIACVATKLAGSKNRLVVSEHMNLFSNIADSSNELRKKLLPLTTRWIYPLADAIVAVSNGVADDMCRVSGLPRKRVQTIYNPANLERLRSAAAEPLDHPWFASGEPPVIVAIGRLELQKNFPNLLRAFALLRKERAVRLVILGEGSQGKILQALTQELGIQDDVLMPGFVGNPAGYLGRAAVFAMSSDWEGLPVSMIEALALGVPIVSTDCPNGPTEVLQGGTYGELVPVNDSAALAAAIARVLDGERKAPADEWLAQFDAETITQKYLEIMSR